MTIGGASNTQHFKFFQNIQCAKIKAKDDRCTRSNSTLLMKLHFMRENSLQPASACFYEYITPLAAFMVFLPTVSVSARCLCHYAQ